MSDSGEKKVLYYLDLGYKITRIMGKDNKACFRDRYSNLLAIIEFYNNRIISIEPYNEHVLTNRQKKVILEFAKKQNMRLEEDAAYDLGLSTVVLDNKERMHLNDKELTEKFLHDIFKYPGEVILTLNDIKKKRINVPSMTNNCQLNLKNADIKTLRVGKDCDLSINLRDNIFVKELSIGSNFTGSMDLSGSFVKDIKIGDVCRCDFVSNSSKECFNLDIGNFYSGKIEISDSCFSNLLIGHNCDAAIKLVHNQGRKNIKIADFFKGHLDLDAVFVKNMNIGKHCKGDINISSKYTQKGIKRLTLSDRFTGEISISNSVERVEFGEQGEGKIKIASCPLIKIIKFDDDFRGDADLSFSNVVYVRAGKGFQGNLNLVNCDNLALLKIPYDKKAKIKIDKPPLKVIKGNKYLYYQFKNVKLPVYFFTPFHKELLKRTKKLLKDLNTKKSLS